MDSNCNGQGADLRSAVTRLEARMHALEAPEKCGVKGEHQENLGHVKSCKHIQFQHRIFKTIFDFTNSDDPLQRILNAATAGEI